MLSSKLQSNVQLRESKWHSNKICPIFSTLLWKKNAQTCFVERRDIWTSLPVTHTSLAYRLPSSSGCENTGSGGMQEKQVSPVDFSLPNRGTLTSSCDLQVPLSGVPPHVSYLPFFSTWMREWTQRTTRHYRGGRYFFARSCSPLTFRFPPRIIKNKTAGLLSTVGCCP